MKFLFALILASFSFSVFAQSSLESRLARLEDRVAQLEQGSGGLNDSYCACNYQGYDAYVIVRYSGGQETTLGRHYGQAVCDQALARHPSCR